MHHIKIDLSICFKTKWHCGSGEGGVLTDRLVRRDSRDRPFIPGSTLKGVIRECCEKLSRTLGFPPPLDPHLDNLQTNPDLFSPLREVRSPVDAVFGNKFEEGGIFFRDARLATEAYKTEAFIQSRVRRYRYLGTAAEKQLFSSEYAMPLEFRATIEGYHQHLVCFDESNADDPEYPPYGYCLLVAGLMAVDRLGGDKSTGSGEVTLSFESIIYNGKSFGLEKIMEPLDSEFYDDSFANRTRATAKETR